MSLEDSFKAATEKVKKLKTVPTEDELLDLYAFYKQALFGDCNQARPSTFDIKGKYKWYAWNKLKGMDEETAKMKYIEYTEKLIKKYGMIS